VNGLNCNINREGWVGVLFNTTNMAHTQVKLVLLYSTDFGATWNESIIEDWNISARTTTYSLTVGAYKGSSPYDAGQVMYCGVDASPRLAITTDGGASWAYGALLGAGSFVGHVLVDPSDQSRVFVGMRDGVGPWHVVVSLDHGATINDYDTNASENLGYPATAVYYHLSVAMDERKMVRVGARTGLAHIHTTTDDGGSWEEPTPQYSSTSLGISLVQDSPWNLYLLRQLSGDLASVPETCHVVFASNDEGRTMTLKAGANACTIDTGGGDSIPYNCGGVRGILEVWTDLAEAEIEGYPTYHSLGQHPGALSWPQIEDRVGSGAEEVAAGLHASQHEDGGTDEVDLGGLDGEPTTLATHRAQAPFSDHPDNPTAKVYNDAALVIGNAAWTALTFNSEIWDVGDWHSIIANTDRLTVPVDGKYLLMAHAEFAANANGDRRIRLRRGVITVALMKWQNWGAGTAVHMQISTLLDASAGDILRVEVRQDSGGNLNITRQAVYSPYFMVTRIG